MIRLEGNGKVLAHRTSRLSDVDYTNADFTLWTKIPIYEKIVTSYLYGLSAVRKWGAKILTRLKNRTFMSLQPSVALDGNDDFKPLSQIIVGKKLSTGPEQVCPDITYASVRHDSRDVLRMRRMPEGYARFNSRQVQFEKAFTIMYSSDSGIYSSVTVSIDTVTNNITFTGLTAPTLADTVGKYMFFKTNTPITTTYFNTGFLIDAVVGVTGVHVVGDLTTVPVATDNLYNWIIKGYNIDETLNLMSATMYYVPFGESYESSNGTK
jgi:hypothetical protein